MALSEALAGLGARGWPVSVDAFGAALDPRWITAVLAASARSTIRRRKLPAELVVWLVIAMALFRNRSMAAVVEHLGLVVPGVAPGPRGVSSAAIAQARQRVGPEPLAALFAQVSTAWAGPAVEDERWHDLAVYGVDGTTLRVADTAANVAAFGRPGVSRGDLPASYPQVRVVVLLRLRGRLLSAAAVGPYTASERALSDGLWTQLPPRSLVVLDRGFTRYALFHQLHDAATARHWLVRARSGPWALRTRVITRHTRDDQLVALVPTHRRRAAPPPLPPTLIVRAVRVRPRGFRPYLVYTSLLDPARYPAAAIAALYHERWELELAFDELKTHTLERLETLRSQAPAGVEQELWGLLLAYNLVRYLLQQAATHAGCAPNHLSFRTALLLVQNFLLTAWVVAPGTLPRHLTQLVDDLALHRLPPRRPRRYPRAVKIKTSAYLRKRPGRRRRTLK